jgi:hypothetical protein
VAGLTTTVSTWPRRKRWALAKTANKAIAPIMTSINTTAFVETRDGCDFSGGSREFTQ